MSGGSVLACVAEADELDCQSHHGVVGWLFHRDQEIRSARDGELGYVKVIAGGEVGWKGAC
eukprot:m.1508 g.1508  ORF g.1508 m.1508 type:complete len:61 (+) comp2269_c0_seq1:445-627(+)